MRWIAFAILLYCVAVVQTTVAPMLTLHGVWPDFLIIVAVYYALAAAPTDAMLACWVIGLVIDLTGSSYLRDGNVGVGALSLGLIALLLVKLRDLTFRDSVWTALFFTFLAKLMLSVLSGVHMIYLAKAQARLGDVIIVGFYSAVYTAVLAPYGHWLLRRLRGPLGVGVTYRWGVR